MKTIDPTQKSLEAALLDQKVAGTFEDKSYAYVAVIRHGEGKPYGIGIAVEGEHGYSPIEGGLFEFDKQAEADEFVDGMNRHIGLTELEATKIIVSSMRRPNRLRLSVENF